MKAKKPTRLRRSVARIRGMGFILWQARHEFYHVLLGLMWAWVMREQWQEFNVKWIWTAIFGSLLPDADHFVYWLTYGKRDPYTKAIFTFLKNKEWRILVKFIARGHKYNTNLTFHNYYVVALLFTGCVIAYMYDSRFWVILFGAMLTHYAYDIFEDVLILGHVNPNWKRLGRSKKSMVVGPPIDEIIQ
ncbi:MAG TPA: hypothetical protein VMR81_05820 [Patescibacteria group bacterium]|nr:hypothetical protein [Patescibacteria group bacterium]